MKRFQGRDVRNWYGDIVCHPSVVVYPESEAEVVKIAKDSKKYPSPLRPLGSRHSITGCLSAARPGPDAVADNWGTAVDMSRLPGVFVVEPIPDGKSTDQGSGGGGKEYLVTVSASAGYLDVAQRLKDQFNIQLFVNTELGSLTMGAAACGATKDSSFDNEWGQVGSYAVAMKLITPLGDIQKLHDSNLSAPGWSQVDWVRESEAFADFGALRSSYGLFGLVTEIAFRAKAHHHISIIHETLDVDDFERHAANWSNQAAFLYLFPHAGKIVVEHKGELRTARDPSRWRLRLRNFAWRWVTPFMGRFAAAMPARGLRDFVLDVWHALLRFFLVWILKIDCASPVDQIVDFDKPAKRFTFSMWAFPEAGFAKVLREYFELCQEYRRTRGYRANMPNASYRIGQDQQSLLSYSFDNRVWTLDPVSTGVDAEWPEFLERFNEFCRERGGIPLFNQTPFLTPEQAQASFLSANGRDRLQEFAALRRQYDPNDRMLNDYFFQRLP